MHFDELDYFPERLLDVPAARIKTVLPHPTLIHLAGEQPGVLFVSVLLHGNEDVGLKAVQQLMKSYLHRPLPKSLSVFIGNVDAAEAGVRYLPHQRDYNRVWPGSELDESPEHALMRDVVAAMVERPLVASVDLHNNSGRNPLYACVCSLTAEHLRLGAMFSPLVLYFLRPKGVQTQALSPFCPSITCECGPIGDVAGVVAAADLLQRCMELEHISHAPVPDRSVRLFHTVATLRVQAGCTVGFGDPLSLSRAGQAEDVLFRLDLDHLNFRRLPAGEVLGRVRSGTLEPLEVRDESGRVITGEVLACVDGQLRLQRSAIPSMLTLDVRAIEQDCVGYLMEPYPLSRQLAFLDDSEMHAQ
jgi:hypothetical protein